MNHIKRISLRNRSRSGEGMTLPVYISGPVADTPEKAVPILAPLCDGERQELFFALPLTKRGTLLGEPVLVHKGTVDEVHVWARDVFREAIVRGAVGMLVAHNHPSGDVSPSLPDRALTAKLIEAGKVLDIILVNHLVVNGAGECASIKGWIFPGYKKLGFVEWE